MATARVTISDPQKIGDSLNAYISYKVTTELSTKLAGLDSQTYTVIRRFSDFVWLRSQLRDAFPFLIIPSLPEKQQIGRFNQEFVDVRLRALVRWIERVGANAEVVATPVFKNFISMPAEPFSALRDGSRSDLVKGVANTGKRTMMRAFKTASVLVKDAIATARGTGAPAAGVSLASSKTAEDAAVKDLELYLLGQGPLLTALYNSAAASAVRSREQAQLLLDFGAALRALGQTEEGTPLGNAFNQVGLASWASSTAAYESAVCQTEAFVERLADYVRGSAAVREMLEARSRASADRADALSDVERLNSLISALNANPTAQGMKDRAAAESELVAAKKDAETARALYDEAAAAVVAQTEKLQAQMLGDFRSMLLDFVTTQVRTELKLAAAWDKVSGETQAAAAAMAVMPQPGAVTAGMAAVYSMAAAQPEPGQYGGGLDAGSTAFTA